MTFVEWSPKRSCVSRSEMRHGRADAPGETCTSIRMGLQGGFDGNDGHAVSWRPLSNIWTGVFLKGKAI